MQGRRRRGSPAVCGGRALALTTSDDGQSAGARRSGDRLGQPWPSPPFSSAGLQALAKFVQASPSLQTPAMSPVSPLKWTQEESTFPHAMSPRPKSQNASIFMDIETEQHVSVRPACSLRNQREAAAVG